MKHNYTENELVQFIYKDMEAIDYCELLFSIDDNPELKTSYEKMIGLTKQIPKVNYTPSFDSMHMIIAYSKI
jgi:hypothetical protein